MISIIRATIELVYTCLLIAMLDVIRIVTGTVRPGGIFRPN
jgi:hypothetical protein